MVEKVLYVARDKDNTLCAYTDEPEKNEKSGFWMTINNKFEPINDLEHLVPELKEIKWTDEAPRKIKIMEDTK